MTLAMVRMLFRVALCTTIISIIVMELGDSETLALVLLVLSILTIAAAGVAFALFWRCPDCGRHLGRHVYVRFCPHCVK